MQRIKLNNDSSILNVYDQYLTKMEADNLLNYVDKLDIETRPEIVVYGKICKQNRDVGFFSDESHGYKYSGRIMKSQKLTPLLKNILNRVNATLNTNFNGILINRYNDGNDNIGAHLDDESTLCNNTVASISLGSSRIFRVKNKKTSEKIDIDVHHGQLLVMAGTMQKYYTHEIPKQLKIRHKRISLTFRMHIDDKK